LPNYSDDPKADYPWVRPNQINEAQPNFDPKAYHDPETGHYTMPEDKPLDNTFLDKSGLYLPKPTGKMITNIIFDNGQRMEVAEEVDDVLEMLSGDSEFVTLSNAVYDGMTVKVDRANARAHLLIIESIYKDMDAEKQNLELFNLNKRAQAQQIDQARAQMVFGSKPNNSRR
jgi:hypothetical protein